MYLAVWSNAVWELKPDGKPALATIDEVFAVPPTPLPQLWELPSCFEKSPTSAIPRTDATKLKDRFKELREDGGAEGLRARDRDADGLLRLAAARAAGARERADVHGRRRPRRDRRLEPRPRVARPRLHVGARAAHHHERARRLRRVPGLGQRPAALPQPGRTATMLDCAPRSTSRDRARTRATTTPAPSAEKRSRSSSASTSPTPRSRRRSSSGTSRSTARATACSCSTRARAASTARATCRPGCSPRRRSRSRSPTRREQPLPAGLEMLVVVSQTPPVLPTIATRYIVPVKTRVEEFKHHSEFRRLTGLEPDNEIWPGDDVAYEALLKPARRVQEGRRALGRGALRRGRRADLLDEGAEAARPRRAVRGRPEPHEPDRDARRSGPSSRRAGSRSRTSPA